MDFPKYLFGMLGIFGILLGGGGGGGPGTLIGVSTTLRRSAGKGDVFWTKCLDLLDYRYCLFFSFFNVQYLDTFQESGDVWNPFCGTASHKSGLSASVSLGPELVTQCLLPLASVLRMMTSSL